MSRKRSSANDTNGARDMQRAFEAALRKASIEKQRRHRVARFCAKAIMLGSVLLVLLCGATYGQMMIQYHGPGGAFVGVLFGLIFGGIVVSSAVCLAGITLGATE